MQANNAGSEMSPEDTATQKSRLGSKWRGLRLYVFLLSVQTAGVAVLFVNMVPLYRSMSLDFSNYQPAVAPWWAVAGILMIQTAYWFRVRLQPPLPRAVSILSGHIVLFVARLSFVTVTSGFSVMFLNRFEDLANMNYPPIRALVVLVIFFSLFCWTLELERLGRALQESRNESGKTNRDT